MPKEKSPLDFEDWPAEGGSYTRGKDGALSRHEHPTQVAETGAMSEGSAQDEQEKREQAAARETATAKAKAKHK